MYDRSQAEDFRNRTAVLLGNWHPLRMLMILIWRRFGHIFWGPLQHFVFPGSKFWKSNVKTDRLHALFTYVRLAYATARDEFSELMDEESSQLSAALRSVVTNLYDLFEFYIPLVPPLFNIQLSIQYHLI